MSRSLHLVIFILAVASRLYAQHDTGINKSLKSAVVIKITPLPFLFESAVAGTLQLTNESLSFIPKECTERDKKFSAIFPCNNHLINTIQLNFSELSTIRRRNYLLIFPNRIIVRKPNGETYLFFTYKRKRIIDAFKKYTFEHASVSINER